jgi:2-polyprenyl-3-methyl-5-hydroxy-6-metoxy-1,4-benzoquinol methylase
MEVRHVDSLTDTNYWDRTWANRTVPNPLDPSQGTLNGTVARSFHRFFERVFGSLDVKPGDLLLEAGCGGSVFLPYFCKQFGLAAEGLDNSEEGCGLSQAISEKSAITTRIVLGDVLNPPESLSERYRVVFSLGLAEHFQPTTDIVAALKALVQPSGFLITIVPNMHGAMGLLQRLVDPSVYAVHVPLSPRELADAHRSCGLEVVEASHLMTVNFSVLNFSGPRSRVPARVGLRIASWASKAIWTFEKIFPQIPNGITSPFVAVVARKQASSPSTIAEPLLRK